MCFVLKCDNSSKNMNLLSEYLENIHIKLFLVRNKIFCGVLKCFDKTWTIRQ